MAGLAFLPILAASALAFPQPGNDIGRGTAPFRSEAGFGLFRLFVAPDKQVLDCQTVYADFEDGVAEKVCQRLLQRKAFVEAQGADGQPIHGTMLYLIDQRGGGGQQLNMRPVPVMEATVQSLPAEYGSRKSVGLQVQLDPAGKVTYCESADADGDPYAEVACQLAAQATLAVRHDANGAPVAYVDSITVDFITE